MRKLFAAGLVVVTLALTLLFAHSRALGQAAKPADPIFGRWMMDQTKSVNNRRGDHATYPTQHMRILAPDGDGLRNTLANSPTSSPEYSYSGTFDGKDHPDPRTPGKDQTLAHWRLGIELEANPSVEVAARHVITMPPCRGWCLRGLCVKISAVT